MLQLVMHNGALPGFLSQVMLFPADGVGIATFINSDDPSQSQTAMSLAIAHSLLGIKSPVEAIVNAMPTTRFPTPAPAPAQLSCAHSTALAAYAGTYTNPGYGNFTLCTTTSKSNYCAGVLSDWSAALPNGTLAADALYGAWPRFLSSHIRFLRLCDSAFRLTLVTPFPNGYGNDTTPFVYLTESPGADVECVERDGEVVGCGFMNTEEHDGPRSTEGSVEDRADVWFTRVS